VLSCSSSFIEVRIQSGGWIAANELANSGDYDYSERQQLFARSSRGCFVLKHAEMEGRRERDEDDEPALHNCGVIDRRSG